MEIKNFNYRFRVKGRFDKRFYGILILVGLCTFVFVNFLLSFIISSAEKALYTVKPLDEMAVYGGNDNGPGKNFYFLRNGNQSNLNGADVSQNTSRGQVCAVIIENYTPIRHLQKGLDKASIVYETLAEGGITRFLALFEGEPADVIGPVRSARPYFVSWASEYRAGFAHVGGSQEALGYIKENFRIFNLDEFSDSKSIWRNKNYDPPHNAFTSTYNILSRLNENKYYHPMTEERFPFKDPDTNVGDINTIKIDFSIEPYAVKYVFDPKDSTYLRYNGGKLNDDIKASDVIVQFVDSEVLDDVGRLRIQTNGTGKALVFRDGKVIEGTWEKDSSINSNSQSMKESWTKFFDKDGKQISMNKGQIWIEVVPNGRPVNYF